MKKKLKVSKKWEELAKSKTLCDLLKEASLKWPDKEAIIFKEERVSYRKYWENARQMAKGLYAMGIRPGDHVGLWMTNRPEWCYSRFGIYLLGAVMIPINTRYKIEELDYIFSQSDVKAIITEKNFLGKIDTIGLLKTLIPEIKSSEPGKISSAKYPLLKSIVCLDSKEIGCFSGEDMLQLSSTVSEEEVEVKLLPEDLIHIIYTSGTTGFPKGVMTSNIGQIAYSAICAEAFNLREDSRVLLVTPFFGNIGLGVMTWCLIAGATLVTTDRFDIIETLRLVEKEKITHAHFVPTVIRDILSHPEMKNFDLTSLKYIKTGGSYVPGKLLKEAKEKIGAIIMNGYGLSEASGLSTWVPIDDTEEHMEQTVGLTMPNCEISIRDPKTNEELPPGKEGEICIKEVFPGSCLMKGYYKSPELTRGAIVDGWLHTGDLGLLDEEGYLKITGRLKEMFIVGGFNVSPTEIEDFLLKHPKIQAVSVVGVPDERLGEVGAAFVQLKKGETATAQEIIDYCKGKIANMKIPRYVFFVEEFPLNPQGKVQKFKQREWAIRELGLKEGK
jgi:fatty-acyl-CoA synthase